MTGSIDRRTLIVGSALALLPAGATGREEVTSAAAEAVDWDRLRRPLHLAELAPGTACPRSEGKRFTPHFGMGLGKGAVHPVGLGPDGVINYRAFGGGREDGGWFYAKVIWAATPDYAGPILVRGRQLDGSNEVRFDEGADPPREKRLDDPAATTVGAPGLRHWTGYIRVRAPGCYACQVDGLDFSEVMVFQAVMESPEELTAVPVWVDGTFPLPRELVVDSGVRLADGTVRLALAGAKQLVVRLDVGPSQQALLGLSGRDLETAAGTVHWVADMEYGWPRVAAWDDGRRRYQLEVLDAAPGARSDAWSEGDLVRLVEAFAAAPEPGAS